MSPIIMGLRPFSALQMAKGRCSRDGTPGPSECFQFHLFSRYSQTLQISKFEILCPSLFIILQKYSLLHLLHGIIIHHSYFIGGCRPLTVPLTFCSLSSAVIRNTYRLRPPPAVFPGPELVAARDYDTFLDLKGVRLWRGQSSGRPSETKCLFGECRVCLRGILVWTISLPAILALLRFGFPCFY